MTRDHMSKSEFDTEPRAALEDDIDRCPICAVPFKPDDVCADDITEGTCHAECLEGSPVVDLETGDELPDGKVDTYLYREVMEPQIRDEGGSSAGFELTPLAVVAALTIPPPQTHLHVATPALVGIELAGVAQQLEQGGGAWRACSGCHELIDGHPTGPWSETLKSYMGGGCRECGGIGAIWDNTDYSQVNDPAPMTSSKEADLPVLSEASLPTTSRLSQLEAHKSCAASINDQSTLIDQPPQNHVAGVGLLPIYAEGGIGARLMEAMEAYRKDYVFSPDDGWDHDPTEFEKVMLEDFMNGAFNEQVTAILQEAARAAMPPSPPPQDQAAGSRPMDEASLPNTSRLSQLEARTSCAASVNDQLMPPSPQPQDHVQAYRFLAEGDLIEATDEFIGNDGQTWVRPDGWEVGMKYPSRVFKSARRLVSPPSPDQTTEAQ